MSADDLPQDGSSSAAPPTAPRATPRYLQFSLGALLLVVTTIAVGLGMLRSFPLVTVLLVVWIAPAVLHANLSCRMLRGGASLDLGQRLDRFGLGLVYVCLSLLVALGTLWAAMLVLWTFVSDPSRLTPMAADALLPRIIAAAAVCGLLAGSWIFWLTLPKREPAE
jgi:NADH:ubiquinone oxidoreductase subunit 6 (subunit J)